MQFQYQNSTRSPSFPALRSPSACCRNVGRVLAKAGGNGADAARDARVDLEKQREIAKMLLTTQKNMLALNNSRVKVQEELAVANRKIADLEREVERLRAEAAAAQKAAKEAQLPPPFSDNRGVSVAVPPPPLPPQDYQQQQQMPQQQMQQQQQQPTSPPPPPPPPPPPQQVQQQQQQQPPQQQQPQQPAPPATINLTYISGWHQAYIHFTVDGKSWTNAPGMRLQPSQHDHATKTISIEGSSLEFVMNNGENDWDSPGRYSDKPKNYEISSPGSYRLKSGKLEKIG